MNHSPNPEMVIANRKNFNFTSEDLQDFLLKYHEHMMKNKTFMNAINGSSNGTNPHATDNSCDDYCDNSAMRQIFDDYKHDIHGYVTLAVSFFFVMYELAINFYTRQSYNLPIAAVMEKLSGTNDNVF